MQHLEQRSYFFDAGIRFTCRRCGACCTGAPGVVRASAAETESIARYLGQPVSQTIETHLTAWNDGYRIREADDGRCLFFDNGCLIYPVRPAQCRSFPFWFGNLRSEARWMAIQKECQGIGKGRLFSKADILNILSAEMSQKTFNPLFEKHAKGLW